MNQKGNEPMTTVGLRIPIDLLEAITETSQACGIPRSEYIRLALEYVHQHGIELAVKKTFKGNMG